MLGKNTGATGLDDPSSLLIMKQIICHQIFNLSGRQGLGGGTLPEE